MRKEKRMNTLLRILAHVVVILTIGPMTFAQERAATITEPGIFELADLFKSADAVALVKIMAGDAENYPSALYKAEVSTNFKGLTRWATIYFGPFLGHRLGWEYILFLRRSANPAMPKPGAKGGFGTVGSYEVFNEGYTSMETSYECVFNGKEVNQQCDYGVRVCTDYIRLPKGTYTSPPLSKDVPFGCRWVRKADFLSLIERISDSRK